MNTTTGTTVLPPEVDLNERDSRGRTRLYHAINQEKAEFEMVRDLLERGANPNLADHNGRTSLHCAMAFGHVEISQHLIEKGARLDMRTIEGRTPLHAAAERNEPGHLTLVDRILKGLEEKQRIEQVNAQDEDHQTPLHRATLTSSNEMIKLLIRNGAIVNAKTIWGYLPLHFAAQNGRIDIAETLIRKGASVDTKNTHGISPKKRALQRNQVEMAHFLAKNSAKNTSLIQATHPEMHDLLCAEALLYQNQTRSAAALYEKIFIRSEVTQDISLTIQTLRKWGDVLLEEKKYKEAESLFNTALALCEELPTEKRRQYEVGRWRLFKRLAKTEARYCEDALQCPPKKTIDQTASGIVAQRKVLALIRQTARESLENETTSAQLIMGKITEEILSLTRSLIEECLNILGPAPCKYAIIAFGPLSRGEGTPYETLHLGILIEKEPEAYFEQLMSLLKLKMKHLEEKPSFLIQNMSAIGEENALFETACFVYGRSSIFDLYERRLSGTPRQESIIQKLKEILHTFDHRGPLKTEPYSFFEKSIQSLCLYYGISEKNVWKRLDALQRGKIIHKTTRTRLVQVAETLYKMNLQLSLSKKTAYQPNERELTRLIEITEILLLFYANLEIFCKAKNQSEILQEKDILNPERIAARGRIYAWSLPTVDTANIPQIANHLNDPKTLMDMADVLYANNQFQEAQKQYEQVLLLQKKSHEYLPLIDTLLKLGNTLRALGKYKEATKRYLDAMNTCSSHYGKDHPRVAESLLGQGLIYSDTENGEKAAEFFEKALQILTANYGKDHYRVADALLCRAKSRKEEEAIADYERALTLFKSHSSFGENHPRTADTLLCLAQIQRGEEAVSNYEQALAIYEKTPGYGEGHPRAIDCLKGLGHTYFTQQNTSEAEVFHQKILTIYRSF